MKCRRKRRRTKPRRKLTALRIFKVAGQDLVVLDREDLVNIGPSTVLVIIDLEIIDPNTARAIIVLAITGQVQHRRRIDGLPSWNVVWINSLANCAN
jgi:hypothetical protein